MFESDRKPPRIYQALSIEIPERPPTANARRHWRSVARDNALWKEFAEGCTNDALVAWERAHGVEWKALEDANVGITFVCSTRAVKDWDNLVSTLKPLLDGIVAAGALVDDSIRVIGSFTLDTLHVPGKSATVFDLAEPI